MRRNRNYEDDDWLQSDILGTGQYQSIPYKPGKSRHKHPIGFIRQDRKPPRTNRIKVVGKYSQINSKD